MTHYDVFNGDADGICALQQLRLAEPKASTLITGVKRDIQLLKNINGEASDTITALDISFDKNRTDVIRLLDKSIKIEYFDHHFAGDIPDHPKLKTYINTASDTCTSLIVDTYLSGAHRLWAIVGAFGDNFDDKAQNLAHQFQLSNSNIEKLKNLGIAINYNAYGATEADLHFKPDELAMLIHPYKSPLDFINESETCKTLQAGYAEDLAKANNLKPEYNTKQTALYILPNQAWARRVSGVYANALCQAHPNRAHALLTKQDGDSYLVSVRAPLATKTGADDLCRQFETGGGRKAAAGINTLAFTDVELFMKKFNNQFCPS